MSNSHLCSVNILWPSGFGAALNGESCVLQEKEFILIHYLTILAIEQIFQTDQHFGQLIHTDGGTTG